MTSELSPRIILADLAVSDARNEIVRNFQKIGEEKMVESIIALF